MIPLSLDEARRLGLCRICRRKDGPKLHGDLADTMPRTIVEAVDKGIIEPFVLNYGKEYAHESCISKLKESSL